MDDAEWDEFKGEKIELPPVAIPKDLLKELAEFVQNALEKENKVMSLTTEVLDELYREIQDEDIAASHIISYIQRRHHWDIELLAERQDVDNMLMAQFNLFDEHMWDKVMNTTAISDLHHETYKLSQKYIALAILEVLSKDGGIGTGEQPAF